MKLDSPTEYAKDKVEHEERSDNDERHEEGPVEHVTNCIVCLKRHVCSLSNESICWWRPQCLDVKFMKLAIRG